jgi:CheY-like chemotaxis protein
VTDLNVASSAVEHQLSSTVTELKRVLKIPIVSKLSPFYSFAGGTRFDTEPENTKGRRCGRPFVSSVLGESLSTTPGAVLHRWHLPAATVSWCSRVRKRGRFSLFLNVALSRRYIRIARIGSARKFTGDEACCLAAGMDAYLSKPMDPDDLFDIDEGYLASNACVSRPMLSLPKDTRYPHRNDQPKRRQGSCRRVPLLAEANRNVGDVPNSALLASPATHVHDVAWFGRV